MSIKYFRESSGTTPPLARRIADRIDARLGGAPPEGAIYHAEGGSAGAYWTFDVWESEEAARRFYDAIRDPGRDSPATT